MLRWLAILICLAVGGVAAWQVYLNLGDVVETWWMPYAGGGATAVVVFALLYFPLARHVAEMISDRLSAVHQRLKKNTSGSGLDEVPTQLPEDTLTGIKVCRLCGAPGGPVCSACRAKSPA